MTKCELTKIIYYVYKKVNVTKLRISICYIYLKKF